MAFPPFGKNLPYVLVVRVEDRKINEKELEQQCRKCCYGYSK